MRGSRWVAWVPVALVSALALLTWWLDQTVSALNPSHRGGAAHEPDFVIEQFSARRMNEGGTEHYVMRAKKLVHYRDDNSATVEEPRMTSYEPGKAPLTIQAHRGRLSADAKDAFFQDEVEVRRSGDAEHEALGLFTSFLHVLPDQELATTDVAVTLTNGNSVIRSVGLEFNNRAHTLKLLGKVRGQFATPRKLALSGPRAPARKRPAVRPRKKSR